MNTAAEELGHIEMLATAVAMNLEGAPLSLKEEIAADPVGGGVLGGINLKNLLSAGLSAMPVDSDGVPFDMSHIYASGNIAADMTANVAAESTGRVLATRLYTMTNDPGMKDMLSYLIARDTMHQNQWMAALEELGGPTGVFPIPNSFPQEQEKQEFSYAYLGFQQDGSAAAAGRWSEGQPGVGPRDSRSMARDSSCPSRCNLSAPSRIWDERNPTAALRPSSSDHASHRPKILCSINGTKLLITGSERRSLFPPPNLPPAAPRAPT